MSCDSLLRETRTRTCCTPSPIPPVFERRRDEVGATIDGDRASRLATSARSRAAPTARPDMLAAALRSDSDAPLIDNRDYSKRTIGERIVDKVQCSSGPPGRYLALLSTGIVCRGRRHPDLTLFRAATRNLRNSKVYGGFRRNPDDADVVLDADLRTERLRELLEPFQN
jgi:hypothetical protein